MINLYSCGHDEICFEGRSKECPACKVIEEKDGEIKSLTDLKDGLNAEVSDLKDQIAELESKLNEPVVHAIHQAQAFQPL